MAKNLVAHLCDTNSFVAHLCDAVEVEPQMNTDEHRLKKIGLSAFICVHLWLKYAALRGLNHRK